MPWWRRPVRRSHLLWVSALAVLVWLAVVSLAAWQGYGLLVARMWVRQQPVRLQLPANLPMQAQLQSAIYTQINSGAMLAVPVRQRLSVQVPNELAAQSRVTAVVPVDTVFRYRAQIAVSTQVEALVPIVSWLPSLRVQVPLKTTVPVDVEVPVRAQLPINALVKARGRLAKPIEVDLDTTLRVKVPIRTPLVAQVRSQLDFTLQPPLPVVSMDIESTLLQVPLQDIRWHRRP
jgi:hypothetical protein